MEYKDYYEILGVPRNASDKDVKAAYRRLARKHHPDVNSGDSQAEARFKEINEANAVLGDAEKRRRYDALGADWSSVQRNADFRRARRRGVRVDVGGDEFGGFSDFFSTFFSGGFEPESAGARGADVESEVRLSLEDVVRGTTRTVVVRDDGSERRVEVRIPAGVSDGARVRASGEGVRGRVKHGDLYLRVRVASDPRFERRGDDLLARLRVPLTTAVLGGDAEVATLDGSRGIRIPPGTPAGRTFRLRGLGLPRLGGRERGDLLAALEVEMPEGLSDRERELFEELKKLGR